MIFLYSFDVASSFLCHYKQCIGTFNLIKCIGAGFGVVKQQAKLLKSISLLMLCISPILLLESSSKTCLYFEGFSLPSDLLSLITSSSFVFKASKACIWLFPWY